jgi:hypothetical protein
MVAWKLMATVAAFATIASLAIVRNLLPSSLFSSLSGGQAGRSLAKPGMNPGQEFQQGYTSAQPKYTSMLDVLLAWNPDDPTRPTEKVAADTLEVLDWTKQEDRERAAALRNLEVPFKLIKLKNVVSIVFLSAGGRRASPQPAAEGAHALC